MWKYHSHLHLTYILQSFITFYSLLFWSMLKFYLLFIAKPIIYSHNRSVINKMKVTISVQLLYMNTTGIPYCGERWNVCRSTMFRCQAFPLIAIWQTDEFLILETIPTQIPFGFWNTWLVFVVLWGMMTGGVGCSTRAALFIFKINTCSLSIG